MPSKKNSRRRAPVNVNLVGIAKKHLLENFSNFPIAREDFLNGHILCMFVSKCNKSFTRTERELLSLLPSDSATSLTIKGAIRKVVHRTWNKFRRLTDPNEFKKFDLICQEKFSWRSSKVIPSKRTCTSTQSVLQNEEMVKETVTVGPIPTSPMKTRHISQCSSCKIIRQSILKLQQEITAVKNLPTQQKKREELITSLNQKMKRKELQLSNVKSQFESSVLAKDLKVAKVKIASLEKKHRRLKKYHKVKEMGFFSSETIEGRLLELERKLVEKDEEILLLQDDKLTLEEKNKELKSVIELTKSNLRTYSPENRMKV